MADSSGLAIVRLLSTHLKGNIMFTMSNDYAWPPKGWTVVAYPAPAKLQKYGVTKLYAAMCLKTGWIGARNVSFEAALLDCRMQAFNYAAAELRLWMWMAEQVGWFDPVPPKLEHKRDYVGDCYPVVHTQVATGANTGLASNPPMFAVDDPVFQKLPGARLYNTFFKYNEDNL